MKKTNFKKSLAFLMGMLMLVSVFAFASCGEKTPAVTDPAKTDAPTVTDAPVATEPVTTVILPEVYEGADFEDYTCSILLGLTTLGRGLRRSL